MMKRKIAGLLLAVTMAVGMTGCAGSSNTGTAAPAGNQTEAAAKEEPSANQPKEESGDTKMCIRDSIWGVRCLGLGL